jgi:hypothetical protein
VAFHHGVGGQRGGHRHHGNVLRLQALGQFGYRLRDGLSDANGQVTLGGDGLG